jgi:hypothetical protein
MSQEDMSELLCDMPDGTTSTAHMINTCAPAGQRPNKTPIFIKVSTMPAPFWLGAGVLPQ